MNHHVRGLAKQIEECRFRRDTRLDEVIHTAKEIDGQIDEDKDQKGQGENLEELPSSCIVKWYPSKP